MTKFFTQGLEACDSGIFSAITSELSRQKHSIELIASENIVSKAVLEAQGSVLTNKYAEGYPSKRYYGGCEAVDIVETLAIERAKKLFSCNFANVQPHSGASANQIVFFTFLKPGDTIMGLDLACGGHLTHGASMTQSGKWFNSIPYHVKKDGHIDYEEIEQLAHKHKPKLIIAGISSYSRILDFAFFRRVADSIGAILMIDMAHFAGLVAGGVNPNPLPFADVVTSTTHKTLRGPRGGIILWNDEKYTKMINTAVFPGMQGGPLMHVIAAKAVAFGEALLPSFSQYAESIVKNAQILAKTLTSRGLKIVTGGTDNHLMVVDLTPFGITGKLAEKALDQLGLTCNKNTIPFDPESPFVSSGIRLGTPASTTRGFGIKEFETVGNLIVDCLEFVAGRGTDKTNEIKSQVEALCKKFPIYS